MQHSPPAAPTVQEMLERLLASETFSRSERARKLLRYLVEREQAGDADRLKGFSIGVDVFGKDAGFDAANDAVVRVQAGRLRDLLAQYYAGEGAGDRLRIGIARGSYVPSYEIAETAAPIPVTLVTANVEPSARIVAPVASTRTKVPPPVDLRRQVRLFWAAMTAIIAMLGFVVFRLVTPVPAPAGDVAAVTSAATTAAIAPAQATDLPQVGMTADTGNENVARIASVFRRALPGFDTVNFIGLPDAARIDYVFNMTPGSEPDSVVVELQHLASGKVLLSRVFKAGLDAAALDDEVAAMLSAAIPVSGILYAHIEQGGQQTGLAKCLLLNDDYYLDQKEETHQPAYRCLEEMARQNAKSPMVYSELAALELEAFTDKYPYPPDASEEKALKLAHQAVLMGATSPYAHRSYGFLLSRTGKPDESIRFMRKAYELNTFDLSMAAAYAYALIYSADYATGVPIMVRAVENSSAHPTWWDYALFLGAFMLDDMQAAARATEPLASGKRAHYAGARLIVAAEQRDEQKRIALLEQIVKDHPKFAADPRAAFEKANYPADLTDKLVTALRAAGLGGGS